ncbi:hypothetical protein [Microlunatus sp. Y2014]|uniref:hypothetical protein n=1 Tax=Microlunatus sp. Y2014 TaxID=3418488 RepID=UPI003DA75EF2
MHSFHLVRTNPLTTVRALLRPPTPATVGGLVHAECLTGMRLGAPVVSPARMQLSRLAMFASWRDGAALDEFLACDPLGRHLAGGWHVRLEFLRRWGSVSELGLPERADRSFPDEPVVAVTLARMRLPELPRFISWGRPVERLVRDHPGATLAMAAIRPPRTVSTFSVWRSTREMVEMVHGHTDMDQPRRHIDAMAERERRDFHHEFTTLRFRPLSEHGSWQGQAGFVPSDDGRVT